VARKKPCRIWRRCFQPDPRAEGRQRACSNPECQNARRQKTQARLRDRLNPGYGFAWRMDASARGNRDAMSALFPRAKPAIAHSALPGLIACCSTVGLDQGGRRRKQGESRNPH
jgi:hypothetical protein